MTKIGVVKCADDCEPNYLTCREQAWMPCCVLCAHQTEVAWAAHPAVPLAAQWWRGQELGMRERILEGHMYKILIVEDNLMIADQVEDWLLANGYAVCGIASAVQDGLAMYHEHKPDLLIVDLRLAHGDLGTTLVAQLAPTPGLGILYVTASGCEIELSTDNGDACLTKPYSATDLLRAVRLVLDIAKTGEATPPFPAGFRLLDSLLPKSGLAPA